LDSGHVFYRRLDKVLPRALRAEGVWIYDEKGKRYLDASGGPICLNIGHGRSEVARAMWRQAREVAYVHGTMFSTGSVEELARRLVSHAPEGIERFYFCAGGGEAVETAVKLSRQVHLAKGDRERYRLISRWQSYHGATLGALSATGKPSMRDPFIPMLLPVVHIPPPYCLRCFYGLTYPGCGIRCAYALEEAVKQEGPNTISAFLAETICGATLGAVVPPREYYDIISSICRRYGIFLILDEVMCGLGRTGAWFAAEHYGLKPDFLVLGKGLSGGYIPLSAVGCRREYMEIIQEKAGNFMHGHTYSHHPVAAAAGVATLEILERENLVARAQHLGVHLEEILKPLRQLANVGDVRGRGLMWAVEFVKDKNTLEPFDRSKKVTERLYDHLMDSGIITYKCTGFAGGNGDALMLGPPFIIEREELGMAVQAIGEAVEKVLG